eukprot:Hpha_TRINITY_DN10425_c0_g1::TRINITY_DN10425_c0_g1_i1::g.193494::m.193494
MKCSQDRVVIGAVNFAAGALLMYLLSGIPQPTARGDARQLLPVADEGEAESVAVPAEPVNFTHLNATELGGDYVEDLMYKYGSDKSKDDHAYTNFYKVGLHPIRMSIRNMTEVGTNLGQSIQAWYRMFPNAEIHTVDHPVFAQQFAEKNLGVLGDRIKMHKADFLDPTKKGDPFRHGFQRHSMDLVIDDALHVIPTQYQFLQKLWPLVKPGGLYIIEDVDPVAARAFLNDSDDVPVACRRILTENDAFVVNPTLGHRVLDLWLNFTRQYFPAWGKSRLDNNSLLIVIRKRGTPLKPVQLMFDSRAMKHKGLVMEDEALRHLTPGPQPPRPYKPPPRKAQMKLRR